MCVGRWHSLRVFLIIEREAKDAVSWLKAAGFPQYVQMYAGKDGCDKYFPVIVNVKSIILQMENFPLICHKYKWRLITSFSIRQR